MTLTPTAPAAIDEIMESSALVPRTTGSTWSRDAECAETTRCARRSTICWPPGPATPWSCAHLGRTTPNSTSVIG